MSWEDDNVVEPPEYFVEFSEMEDRMNEVASIIEGHEIPVVAKRCSGEFFYIVIRYNDTLYAMKCRKKHYQEFEFSVNGQTFTLWDNEMNDMLVDLLSKNIYITSCYSDTGKDIQSWDREIDMWFENH